MQTNQTALPMRCHLKPFRFLTSRADYLQVAKQVLRLKFDGKVKR